MATTFNVGSGDYVRPYRNVRIQHFPEAASQTFKRGEPLIMDAAGTENRVRIASTSPTTLIVGIAAADASGVTSTMIPVWCATQDAEFKITGKAAQAMDYTDLGVGLEIEKDATNVIWIVDNTNTSADALVPLSILAPAVQGDFRGYYVVRFAAAASYWMQTV
jgi:hypothetical protein